MKKKPIVFTLIAIVALALACAAVFLYERSKVALIIDDEAAWDLRDASPHKKVIITNDGIVARYVSEDETSYFGDIQDDFTVTIDGKVVSGIGQGLFSLVGVENGDTEEDARWLAAKAVQKGVFGADMQCALINDGPITIVIDSRKKE